MNTLRMIRRLSELSCNGDGVLKAIPVVVQVENGIYTTVRPRLIEVVDIGACEGEHFRDADNEDREAIIESVICLEFDSTV